MKHRIVLYFFLLFHILNYGQSLSVFTTTNIEAKPDSTIAALKRQELVKGFDLAKNYYLLGKCYAFLNEEDIALNYFIAAKKGFEKLRKTEFAKDISLEAYLVISSQENYTKYGTAFLDEYYNYALAKNSAIRLAYAYNEYAKNAHDIFDEELKNYNALDSALTLFNKAAKFAKRTNNPLVKAKVYGNAGTLMVTWRKFDVARSYLDSSAACINPEHQFELFVNNYNYGNSYFNQNRYKDALARFLKANEITLPYYRNKSKRKLYKKIAQTYDFLNINSERRIYEKLHDSLDALIKDVEQNKMVHEINIRYEVAEKDMRINALQKVKLKFAQNKIVFGVLLFFVFLLALYSFIRWKKIDYKRKKLEHEKQHIESEHSKTVEQLEKVKQLIIEDHIILKNKSKIYLEKLAFIKAEDHYLNIISIDGKKNFIRGKLSNIMNELPPNFVQCHRSYIVNKNFIKSISSKAIILTNLEEIPVSRSFRL